MLTQTSVGPTVNAVGTYPILRGGKGGDVIVSQLHGRYYESCYNNNMYVAASQAVATTTVGLATTYTGLSLANPVNSGVNLVILKTSVMQSIIQAVQVEAVALATGYNATTNVTHTTPLATRPLMVGGTGTAVGLADISATLPTAPFYSHFFTNTGSATTNSPGITVDFEGSIILRPGAYLAFVTPAQASVAGMWFSVSWEEVAI